MSKIEALKDKIKDKVHHTLHKDGANGVDDDSAAAAAAPGVHRPTDELEDKPVETRPDQDLMTEGQDPSNTHTASATALEKLVDHSSKESDLSSNIHAHSHHLYSVPWLTNLVPGIEKVAIRYHVGNYVIDRRTGKRFFESMPIYARIGMHLLFYGKEQTKLLQNQTVENLLREQSVKEGRIFNSPESTKNIPYFIKTYSINTEELLKPHVDEYGNFNEFFYRQLKPDARPVANLADPNGFCSAADCRLTVYPDIEQARQFWIKGNGFTVPTLLNLDPASPEAQAWTDSPTSIAIFRLAPADYHRFHSPADATLGGVRHIPGQYYTVNPQAVNEPGLDVFTANTRSVLDMTSTSNGQRLAFVAIGALLVGSIEWTNGGKEGSQVVRGEELGYFAYGGSTIVMLWQGGGIHFEEDLLTNSRNQIETLVRVGDSLGSLTS